MVCLCIFLNLLILILRPITYYAFYCKSEELTVLFALMIVASPIVVLMPVIQCFHDVCASFSVECISSLCRTKYFVPWSMCSPPAFPSLWCCSCTIFSIALTFSCSTWWPRVCFLAISALEWVSQRRSSDLFLFLGLFLYITKIPERFWPGAFDLLVRLECNWFNVLVRYSYNQGTSHQIWHCLVLIGMTSVGKVIIDLVEYRLATNTCNIWRWGSRHYLSTIKLDNWSWILVIYSIMYFTKNEDRKIEQDSIWNCNLFTTLDILYKRAEFPGRFY